MALGYVDPKKLEQLGERLLVRPQLLLKKYHDQLVDLLNSLVDCMLSKMPQWLQLLSF